MMPTTLYHVRRLAATLTIGTVLAGCAAGLAEAGTKPRATAGDVIRICTLYGKSLHAIATGLERGSPLTTMIGAVYAGRDIYQKNDYTEHDPRPFDPHRPQDVKDMREARHLVTHIHLDRTVYFLTPERIQQKAEMLCLDNNGFTGSR